MPTSDLSKHPVLTLIRGLHVHYYSISQRCDKNEKSSDNEICDAEALVLTTAEERGQRQHLFLHTLRKMS